MQAEIITIGDEILIGQIVDTNSAFLGKEFNKNGISIYQITSIQDDKKHILNALEEAEDNADIIIITGGLGPTKDDVTKETLCEYFNDTLIENDAVLQHVQHLFQDIIKRPMLPINEYQALVPTKATVLHNKYGTAPGMWFEKNGKVFVSLPGVPYEMKALITDEVLPRLRQKFKFPYIYHKTLLTYGMGESAIAKRIEAWEDALPSTIKLAYLPNLGKVRLRLSSKGTNKEEVEASVYKQIEGLLPLIEDIFIGYEDETTIAQRIGQLLTTTNQTLAIAESCTGGALSKEFTEHPGASSFFKGSVVSYATELKTSILKVSEELIAAHSVVSTEVAEAMALGAKAALNADYAISTTGNAGPTKGDSNVEIGTVCIAIATPTKVFSKIYQFGQQRQKTITKATNKALEMFQKEILKK